MRGLAAVLTRSGEPAPDTVGRMLAAAPHRGNRTVVKAIGACALGVSELEGRDEASLASDGSLAVAFAGALDNAAELSDGLGVSPEQTRPADIVLAAFRAQGPKAPAGLRGTYACVVADGTRVWAFRDHGGLETLFFRSDPDALYLASEVKQVLSGANVAPEPDLDTVEALFYGELDEPTACALRGARRLVAATLLTADRDSLDVAAYWDPASVLETARLSPVEATERFREVFGQAIARMVTGHDAVSLSGGVDSPPIAAYGNRVYEQRWSRPIPALSAVYPSYPESDESTYIELVAERLGLPLHAYEPGPQRLDRLQFWLKLFDGPWSTWSPEGTAERCAQAQALGFTTILSGEFAEQVSAIRAHLVTHLPRSSGRSTRPAWASGTCSRRSARRPPRELSRHASSANTRPRSYRHGSTSAASGGATEGTRCRRDGAGPKGSCRSSARIRSARRTSTPTRCTGSAQGGPGRTSTSGSSSSACRPS